MISHKRIGDYFQRRIQADPSVTQAGAITSLWRTYADGIRTEIFSREDLEPYIALEKETPSISLIAQLYTASHPHPGGTESALFALYDDDTLLWLDDHTSDTEFTLFWRRENIQFQDANAAANFMMQTKFHYLPEPSRMFIVSKVSDIPQARTRGFLVEKGYEEELQEYDQKLADVAPKLYPPSLTQQNNIIELRFCVWLMAGGIVWNISCRFDPSAGWSTQGNVLGSWVGEMFIPR